MDAIPPNPPLTPPASPAQPASPVKAIATKSLHGAFLEKAIPEWLTQASTSRRQALKDTHTELPAWYRSASTAQREALHDSTRASVVAQNRLDKTMASFQDIEAFARPLLLEALNDQFQLKVDVDKTLLCLKRPLEAGIFAIELSSFEVLKLSMLDAALHNFEAYECEAGAYHTTSGFVTAGTAPQEYEAVTLALTVSQFLTLCRSLDIGKQYQTYLQEFFHPTDAVAETAFREQFISSQKAAMRAAAELALLKKDIEPAHYAMIVSVVDGELNPRVGNKPVWFRDLSVMNKRMTGCVVFAVSDKYRYADEWIIYIPHDPEHPFKCYRGSEDQQEFKRLLTARTGEQAKSAEPTAYQRFLSQFLAYDQRPYFFSQFTRKAADSPSDHWRTPWRTIIDLVSRGAVFTRIRELPPPPAAKLEPEPDPYIAPNAFLHRGRGLWASNQDLWEYLYKESRAKVLADARSHAVPSADVDVKAREAKLAHLLQIGLLGLNMVSMFVPVLGEVMMVVMAGQLLYETLEGAIEWGEGDRRAAKDHLLDVAENLAQIALMAGVGLAVRKFSAARPEPVLEKLEPVTLPDGQTRLWRPDLSAYESSVSLANSAGPNQMGQHLIDGKTYIRQGSKVYEQVFDESLGKWRIKHPSDSGAWQPVLDSNGRGAWRHNLERPLQWDRLTLLRRVGHATEAFSDSELIRLGEVSGVSDDALRKMHVDHAPPPPELSEAMRLFKADRETASVIEQLRGTTPVDALSLYALPLVTEMPRWPANRALEVFDGPQLSGKSIRYGAERRVRGVGVKSPIQVSRADILNGELPARILAGLDEPEITRLLGTEGARVRAARADEFGKQIADFAQVRQPAIFASLYKGTEVMAPEVKRLQSACPGLSESAADEVLAQAHPDDLAQFSSTRRVPLRMLEKARWYTDQGRQVRAYAGLRSENIASADSRRLALQTLQNLPGWPNNLRLEVREGSRHGALLDSVGSETAVEKKYLIKQGPQFQAFDERGETLNSLPTAGDNFYASVMHALPDGARRSLGVPEVNQSAELQRRIIAYAGQHRGDAPALLKPQAKWLKPPARVNKSLIGYPASGRGPSLDPILNARVRDLYPGMSEQQANGFILEQWQAGKDSRAIAELLQVRRQEWVQLNAALDTWAGPAVAPWERSGTDHKLRTAQALKDCWRNAPIATQTAGADRLSIISYDPLPALGADFSHVRDLTVGGGGMTDANADAFLSRFPNLERLVLGERGSLLVSHMMYEQALTNLPSTVTRMTALRSLKFRTSAPAIASEFSRRLGALTALETLHFNYAGTGPLTSANLDLAPLTHLRKLTIDAPGLAQWPDSLQALPELQRLDLSQTSIASIPDALYIGRERLWAGLSLDWSRFSYETFRPAYEYVTRYMGSWGHLVDVDLMVRQYCAGELEFLTGESGHINPLPQSIMSAWDTPATRLKAVIALRAEHTGIFRQFYQPTTSGGLRTALPIPRWQAQPNARVVRALERSWRAAVRKRYSLEPAAQPANSMEWNAGINRDDPTVFELRDTAWVQGEPSISELPRLPAGTFSKVQTVRLDRLTVPVEQIRDFLQAFSGTQHLEITASGLTEVPIRAGDLAQLTRLDLSFNRIIVTPAVQAQFNGLKGLEYLNARLNQLTALDVTAMPRLKALNLSSNGLMAWPAGAEGLAQLQSLDLRYNSIAALPESVLADDELLLKTSLSGNLFNPDGEAALTAARQRIETTKGLPEGALKRFELESVSLQMPANDPPSDTARSLLRHLLPLPRQTGAAPGAESFVDRLLDLHPVIASDQALQWLAQLRNEGLTDVQIDARLTQWAQSAESLTRRLNGWIFTRVPVTGATAVSAQSRQLAALKIRECWQDGLIGDTQEAGRTLDLTRLYTGDLPSLSSAFARVRTLNLTGCGFSVESFNTFCSDFPGVTRLVLNGNVLRVLPDAIQNLAGLERLELSGNSFADARSVYASAGAQRLRWLDLSHNQLDEFEAGGLRRLETLKLDHNGLNDWPDGVLELQHLRALDLRGNDIRQFPDRLLGGNHEGLVAGTDLSENPLTLNSLEQLRDYSAANADRDVMGYSRTQLDREIERLQETDSTSGSDSDSDLDSDSDGDQAGGARRADPHAGVEAGEIIENPQQEVGAAAMDIWLTLAPDDVRVARQTLWRQLAQEANHEAFFHLLSRLPDTLEFKLAGADLTQRVWQVMQAAGENTELRELLFIDAQTHYTCSDGRILSFSELETRAYEYTALRDIPRNRPEQRGRALVDLTRRLFRLDRVDKLAEAAAKNKDRAEIRLQYRIALARGWPDGLELPAQPEHMLYGTPIRGQRLETARAAVLADEASGLFLEDLIARDYWIRYLEERYGETFAELERDATRRQGEIEDAHLDWIDNEETNSRYLEALTRFQIERAEARTQALMTLSRAELQAPATPASPQPGPSRRP
ncbi:hypothetical protein HU755_25050 [Pseudomonas sp. SWRI111]|uniref:dermonecrotic toxin domain-containing protein n=1 Tax=Pseudomonas sp. SWRI111 TaxID=2745507 RepID=UPI0016476E63|nr:DUF6543 domain-containing protein [Pseudomonas sp. SWRI111]MBC3210077.1 hypothetical protein [Pseudomonas sp. SWRI111]